jgi:hypothetical protein
VIRKGIRVPASPQPICPKLLDNYAVRYHWDVARVRAVISAFGKLPKMGQTELLNRLSISYLRFESVGPKVVRIAPSKVRKRLHDVERISKSLLRSLGYDPNDPKAPPWEPRSDLSARQQLSIYLNKEPVGRAATGCMMRSNVSNGSDRSSEITKAQLFAFNQCLDEFELGLWWLVRQAAVAIEDVTPAEPSGHGGHRRTATAKGQLTMDAIEIYVGLKVRHGTGRRPGFGGPLCRFVQAVGDLFGTTIEKHAIASAWRHRAPRISRAKET